jgi:hypothetical protein
LFDVVLFDLVLVDEFADLARVDLFLVADEDLDPFDLEPEDLRLALPVERLVAWAIADSFLSACTPCSAAIPAPQVVPGPCRGKTIAGPAPAADRAACTVGRGTLRSAFLLGRPQQSVDDDRRRHAGDGGAGDRSGPARLLSSHALSNRLRE